MRRLRSGLLLTLVGAIAFSTAAAQKELSIAEVQGRGNTSAYLEQSVKVTGIVTARIRTGFFLQTADQKADTDPHTSEGIYVYTKNEPMPEAAIGSEVTVVGRVEEYRARNENFGSTITEISHYIGRDPFSVISNGNELPKPVVLGLSDLKPNTPDQFEKYEGMRVALNEMTVVAPTGGRKDAKTESVVSDGVFFGVLKGTPRPFREPGMSILQYGSSKDREKWAREFPRLPIFDGNPEVLRVESLVQIGGKVLNVSSKTDVRNVVGVMHYAYGRYSLLLDAASSPTVASSIKPVPMPAVTDRQFTVGAMNIETFVDDVDDPGIKEDVAQTDAFRKRLGKISLAVRDYLKLPDVIGVVEAENLNVLKRLAERINSDAAAAGQPDPRYDAYLFEGNDARGIDCGFLVKAGRVKVLSAKQFGKDDKFTDPASGKALTLNDRPPIMLEVQIDDPHTGTPLAFTVVANHLKSFRGVDDPEDGPGVRMKKKLQAEFLAKWVNERQKANPAERILLVGDFNAFQFSDGLVDQIGTIKGTPAPKDSVLLASDDLVNPDLVDLVDLIKADQQYSYTFDGNAQVLDHFIANQAMRKHLAGFGYLRVNADYPQILRAVPDRVERFSDHDVAIGYFTFEAAKP